MFYTNLTPDKITLGLATISAMFNGMSGTLFMTPPPPYFMMQLDGHSVVPPVLFYKAVRCIYNGSVHPELFPRGNDIRFPILTASLK